MQIFAAFTIPSNHGWLVKFVEHRIADPRLLRLIRKWLRAGVSEDGKWSETEVGTPQGSVISPVLSNIYLHYVLDLWLNNWRKSAQGDVIIVRYADDWVMGFQYRKEAERFLHELQGRMAKFGLEPHPEKTRLIELDVLQPQTGPSEERASRKPLISWGSRISVRKPEKTSGSQYGGRQSPNVCGQR